MSDNEQVQTEETAEAAAEAVTEKCCPKRKGKNDFSTLVLVAIIAVQIVALTYILFMPTPEPVPVPLCPCIQSVEKAPAAVGVIVLIDAETGRQWRFENVVVRPLGVGYEVFGDGDETIRLPFRCIYLENPTEDTLKKFQEYGTLKGDQK